MMRWIILICTLGRLVTVFCEDVGSCPEGAEFNPSDVTSGSTDEPSIFDELTFTEIDNVIEFMFAQDFNIKEFDSATVNSTYIYLMEILPPAKKSALGYLETQTQRPDRFAKVVLYRGDLPEPIIQEYKVGPLPKPASYELLRYPKWRDPIPYTVRSTVSRIDLIAADQFVIKTIAWVDPMMKDIVGYTHNNCSNRCIRWMNSMPGDFASGSRKIWINFFRMVEGFYLHPVGLQMRLNMRSLNTEDWVVDFVWFRGKTYSGIDALLNDYREGSSTREEESRKPKIIVEDDETLYSSLHFKGEPRPKESRRGPQCFDPDGRRYKVSGHHVEWQGWSFDFTVRSIAGMILYDAKFLGDRILYELSPQEVSVRYSGSSPLPMYTSYHDTMVQMGRETYELFPGVDCPKHAKFFSFAHYLFGTPFLFKNSACIFEWDRAIPLRRHYQTDHQGSYLYYQGMPDNVLVLRSIISAQNYDYIVDYMFHQQGGIEVIVSLSGYILSSYYMDSRDDPYGFETFTHGIGNIHHHLLHFKVDMDIQGQSNRFETLDIKVEAEDDPLGSGDQIFVHKFDRNLRETEKEAAYKFNFDTPKYLLFYNQNSTNKYGNPKGYRLLPVHPTKWLLPENWKIDKSYSWARYQVAVTKHKDDEDMSSTMYNSMDEANPILDFQTYIDDDENIVDQDLVSWVTLGTVHIPHTEDVPIVLTQGVQLTFHLLPYNYFETDPSLASRDNIRVTPDKDGGMKYKYSGVEEEVTCTPRSVKSHGNSSPKLQIELVLFVIIALGWN